MSMSRKHYIAIARVIREERQNWNGNPEVQAALMYVTSGIADVMDADNPHFDRERFVAACRPEHKPDRTVTVDNLRGR